MNLHVYRDVRVTLLLIILLVAIVAPFYPVITMSFTSGILVGVLVYSGHIADNLDRGDLTENFK